MNLVQLKFGTELDVILGLVKEFLASHRVGRFKVMDIGYHVLVKGDTAGSSAANVNSSLCASSGGGSLELLSVLHDGGSHLGSSVLDVVCWLFLFWVFGIVRKMFQDDHSHVLYPAQRITSTVIPEIGGGEETKVTYCHLRVNGGRSCKRGHR